MEIVKDFVCEIDVNELLRELKIFEKEDVEEFKRMFDLSTKIARPKAIYIEGYIESRGDDFVVINQKKFTSRVLKNNLEKIERVFAYIATCGTELDSVKFPDDCLKQYWWESIKASYLSVARKNLFEYIKTRFMLGKVSTMVPGGGEPGLWPIEQQKELFSLFGDVESLIGVRLTDTCLMLPNKSVSGILFPVEKDYNSCRLCRRKNCPGRSADFDPDLWKSIRIQTNLKK